ncbi:hypothetical protein V2J09_018762 [Rumex salicifolius]
MDSRDSSSIPSSMSVTRDGVLTGDEEGVLSVTSSLAKEAAMLFQSRKFVECVDVLMQLSQKKGDDPKVRHNIAVAEFFRDDCSDVRKLIQELANVEKKFHDLACASVELLDAASQPTNTAPSGSKGSDSDSVGRQTSGARNAAMIFRDEFDASVATLNKALILYHLHDYPKAISVLEPVFQNIEPIDEGTAFRVCHLLLDLAVATQDALKFADVLNYVGRASGVGHMINQTDHGSSGHHLSNLVAKSYSVPSGASGADDLNSDASVNANASENSLSRTLSDETIEYETLLSRLDMSGKNIQRPSNLPSSNDPVRTRSGRSSFIDLKFRLPLYRVHFLLLTRSLKLAKRDLKLAMNISRDGDSSSALLLKSQLELARGNYVKAEKLLKASYNQLEIGSSILYDNNVGCIFYQCGKYNTAGVFFSRALHRCSSLRKEKPKNLATVSQDKSVLIMYNCGLQYLACGNPVLAAQCFQKASLALYKRPLLWLRFAECSLMALNKGVSKSFHQLLLGPEFKVGVLGQGKWRQLALEDDKTRNEHPRSNAKEDFSPGTDGAPNLSLSFARQCLWNALHLVCHLVPGESNLPLKITPEESDSTVSASSTSSNHKNSAVGDTKGSKNLIRSSHGNGNGEMKEHKGGAAESSFSLYSDTYRRENLQIKQAILADLTFVELELENPQGALWRAHSLLEMPECTKLNAFLARVYAAEALCLLNKPKEAAEYLSVYFLDGKSIDIPYCKDDREKWQVNKPLDCEESIAESTVTQKPQEEVGSVIAFYKPVEAQGALYVNLASLSAVQGDIEQATLYATQALSLIPNSREANLMAIYLDLKLGKMQDAQTRLRRCTCVSFVPYGSKSKEYLLLGF